MNPECPYAFEHQGDRAAMLAYLGDHFAYHPMNSWNGGFVLAWNIKVHRYDELGHEHGEYELDRRFDEAWSDHVDSDPDIFWEACRRSLSYYVDGDWPNYDGEDGYKFGVNGRSGGYLILEDWPGPRPPGWACCRMTWDNRDDYRAWLDELEDETLVRFYRSIYVLDQDLTREKCEAEVTYHINWLRHEWEEEQIAAERRYAARLEAERPDMYGAV